MNRNNNQVTNMIRPLLVGLMIFAIGLSLFIKRPIHAESNRSKTIKGILFGGAAGGGVAAIAGSAKWFPLGFGVGGLAGGLIVRKIRKDREKRRKEKATQNNSEIDNVKPTPVARRHVRPSYN